MSTVHITIPDEERDRFVRQARSEGMSLGAWMRLAARQRLREPNPSPRLNSVEELQAFFDRCDALDGPAVEPDWEEHLETIRESRSRGMAPT